MMKFKCPKCGKIFHPHPFIAMRHPSKAKCPDCNVKGKITEKGQGIRNSRFLAINEANAAAAETFKEEIQALRQKGE